MKDLARELQEVNRKECVTIIKNEERRTNMKTKVVQVVAKKKNKECPPQGQSH